MSNNHYALGLTHDLVKAEIICIDDELDHPFNLTTYDECGLHLEKVRELLFNLKDEGRYTNEHAIAVTKIEEAIDKLYHWKSRLHDNQIHAAPIPTSYGDLFNDIYQLDNRVRVSAIDIQIVDDEPNTLNKLSKSRGVKIINDLKLPVTSWIFFALSVAQSLLVQLKEKDLLSSPNKDIHWWLPQDLDELTEEDTLRFFISKPWVEGELTDDTFLDLWQSAVSQYPSTLNALSKVVEKNPRPNYLTNSPEEDNSFEISIHNIIDVEKALKDMREETNHLPEYGNEKEEMAYYDENVITLKVETKYMNIFKNARYRHPLLKSKIPQWFHELTGGKQSLTGSALSEYDYFTVGEKSKLIAISTQLIAHVNEYLEDIHKQHYNGGLNQ